jgi:hypothetical protein
MDSSVLGHCVKVDQSVRELKESNIRDDAEVEVEVEIEMEG